MVEYKSLSQCVARRIYVFEKLAARFEIRVADIALKLGFTLFSLLFLFHFTLFFFRHLWGLFLSIIFRLLLLDLLFNIFWLLFLFLLFSCFFYAFGLCDERVLHIFFFNLRLVNLLSRLFHHLLLFHQFLLLFFRHHGECRVFFR